MLEGGLNAWKAQGLPTVCFAKAAKCDMTVSGRKIVGSAQRRQGVGFLQHGSVMLAAEPERLTRVFRGERDPLGGMTTLVAVLGRRPPFDETAERLAEGFRQVHGIELSLGGLSADETARAGALSREKYSTAEWTRDGRAPGRAWSTAGASPHPTLSPAGRGQG